MARFNGIPVDAEPRSGGRFGGIAIDDTAGRGSSDDPSEFDYRRSFAIPQEDFVAPAAEPSDAPVAGAAPPERTVSGTVRDFGITGLKGLVGLGQFAKGLVDLTPLGNVSRAADRVLGMPTDAEVMADTQKALDAKYSEPQQAANQAVAKADGFVGKLKAAVKHPSTIAHSIVESLPATIAGGLVGRGLLAAAPRISPWWAGGIGEGIVGAGSAHSQIGDKTRGGETSIGQKAAALGSGVGTALLGATSGRLAARLGVPDIETMLVSGRLTPTGLARGIPGAAITEGVFEELPQSMTEQVWQNLATGRPLGEGVGGAGAMGMLTGFGMGAGAGGFNAAASSFTRRPAPDDGAGGSARAEPRVPDAPAGDGGPPGGAPSTSLDARLAELDLLSIQRELTPAERAEVETLAAQLDEADDGPEGDVPQADSGHARGGPADAGAGVATGMGDGRAGADVVDAGGAAGPTGAPAQSGSVPDAGAVAPLTWFGFLKDMGVSPAAIRKDTPAWRVLRAEFDQQRAAAKQAAESIAPTGATPEAAPTDAGQVVLQNRDRARAASLEQMRGIAADPDYLRLGPSRSPDTGAPMVFAVGNDTSAIAPDAFGREDVAVMSDGQRVPFRYAVIDASRVEPSNFVDGRENPAFGQNVPGLVKALNNGRTAGLRAAWQQGTAARYLEELAADTAAHGVPESVIRATPNPTLVRIYSEASNTAGMAARSQGQGLGMSPAEIARQDAALIDGEVLGAYRSGDVAAAENRDFVRAFVGRLAHAGQDVAGLMDRDGALSSLGRQRLQAALAQAAYGDTDLVQEMFDNLDSDIKAIGEAMKIAAVPWANMRDSARSGAISAELDVTPNLLEALRAVRKARHDKTSLHAMLNQPDLLTGQPFDPMTARLLRFFYSGEYLTRPVGQQRLAEILSDYAQAAMWLGNQRDLLTGETVTAREIVETILAGGEHGRQAEQAQAAASEREPAGGSPAGGDPGQARAAARRPADAGRGDGPGADRGAEQPAGDSTAEGREEVRLTPDDFDLVGQTTEEVSEQEAQRRQAEAQRQQEAEEQARREAAPSAEDFVLAGSERAADQAAARGQMDLAPVDTAAAQAATSPKNDLPEPTGQRDSRGLTAADRYAQKIDSAASELAGQIVEETKDGDYDGLLATIKRWAKDAKVAADDLRAAVLKALDKIDAPVKQKNAIQLALNPARMVAQAEKAETFVPAPDGSLDYGEITPEMGRKIGRQAGKIRLTEAGAQHIAERHGKELLAAGHASIEEYVSDVAKAFDAAAQPRHSTAIVLVKRLPGLDRLLFVNLEPSQSGEFYVARTGYESTRSVFERRVQSGALRLLWEASARPADSSGETPSLAVSPQDSRGAVTNASSQSSDRMIAPDRANGKDGASIAREIAKARPFDDAAQVRTAAREAITAQLGTQPVDDLIEAIHEGQYEGIAALGASLPVPVTEDQVGVELSNRAFSGTSHTPERRGRGARREYVRLLVDAWRRAEQAAAADPQAMARITAEFEKLRDGYLSRLKAYLSAHGNVASAMIAGPARFPTEANRKRSATADRRASEANDFLRKGAERLLRAAKAPVDRAPESEVERIRANLAAREAQQERMKAANTALRAGDDAALRGLGFDDAEIARLKTPDFAGRTGFPGYALTNNNAEIRRLRERLEQAEQRAQAAQAGPTSEVVAGVRIEEDAQADRIKLIFDGKPDEETRAALKAAGFRWAPSAGAWQRQLTDNARAAARRILDARRAGDDAADTQADAPAFSRRGWRADFPDAVLGHRQGVVHAHPDYQAAKAGDDRAALRLARDMATDDYVAAIRGALPVDARPTIVPVLAVEAAGNNRIPLAIAKVLGDKLGLPVATNIVQARKVSRGGSDGFHRLANPPNFTGPVVAGDYLILDDTLTQGGTLAQLKTHIEDNGGRVLLASALTGKAYSARIALSNERLTQLRERYGSIEPWWRDTFGYGFDGLTESEARFILSLRDRPGSDTLRDRVVAARVRGVGGVDGRDDSDGRDQPPVASRRATEPATAPYETDLFGNPLPALPRRARAARPDRAGLPGDVQPAAAVQDTEAPAGDYFTRTIVGVTAHRKLGANRILTPGDAARATRYLYRSAVERFDGIVTDAAGKPLAVIGGFKGALTQTAVYPATLVGEAVRIPGAARIWFSHNHPSGKAELSAADRMLHQTVADVFRGSGIEPMGLLAVAGDRFAYQSAEPGGDATAHEPIPASDSAAEGARKGRKIAAPSPDGVTVPVIEREIAPDSDVSGHVISAPSDAIDIGRVFYDRAKAPGLMLVNAQHRVIGWVPLPTNTMGDLRNTGGLHAIYRAVSESNAAGAVLVHGGEPALSQTVGWRQVTVAQNIGAALDKIDARLLDSVDVVRRESAASRGAGLSAGPVYARGQSAQPGGLPVRRVTAIAAAISRAWTNPPEVVVIADMQDARVPQRVRDYDAEQRSQGAGEPEGFFLDGKVYLVASQMATPADVVRVLAHEALGHYGLRGLFGGELGRILDQIAAVRRKDVAAKLEEYGLPATVEEARDVLRKRNPALVGVELERRARELVNASRRVAAEEVLAVMAQTNPQLGFVRRAVAAIRTWLRGLGVNLRMTDDEIIRNFIIPARQWVMRGGKAGTGMPAFSRSAMPDRPAAGRATAGLTSSAASRTRDGEGAGSDANMPPNGEEGNPVFSRTTLGARPPTQQPPTNRWQAAKQRAMDLTSPEALDKLIYELQDKFIDLKRVRDHIKALGGTITDLNDAYLGEELYHKRVAYRTQKFLEDELRPLLAHMRTAGVTMPEFERYLHARHAPEANRVLAERNPNQETIDAKRLDADRVVRDLELDLQRAEAAGTATKVIRDALDQARTEQARWQRAQAFRGSEDDRTALSGMSDDEAQAVMDGLSPAKRAHLEALAARVDAINTRTLDVLERYGLMEKSELERWRATYQFYVPLHRDDAHPDSVSHPIGQGFSVRGSASKTRTGSTASVTNILSHVAMQREAALTRGEKNNVAKQLYLMAAQNQDPDLWTVEKPKRTYYDAETGTVMHGVDPAYKSRGDVLMVRIGGRDTAVVFNERNPQAMRIVDAMKNLDLGDVGPVLGAVGKGTRWIASVNTQYNPVFGAINWTRDVQFAMLTLSTTPIAGKQAQVAAGVFPAMRAIYRSVRGKSALDAEWARLWQEFQEAGGTTGYRDLFRDVNDRANALARELAALDRGDASKAAHAFVDWLSDYNETAENAVRLAAFKVALDSGMTKERAASLAKNLTVNFNRKGRRGREANMLYAFFNASIQGTARMAETLRGPAGKRIMAGGVLLDLLNTLLGMAVMGGGDGEDDDEWEKIPEFVKERSIIVPVSGKDYLSIPMPLGFHFLPNIGRLAVEFMVGGAEKPAGRQVGELFAVLADAFNPIGGSTSLAQLAAPTVLDPAVALLENRDWTGRTIYREDRSAMDPTPGHQRTKDTASAPSKAVARALNRITGGTEYRPGAVSWTPDQIDYVIGQLTGGVGRETLKLMQTVAAPLTGDELPMHKVPFVGRIVGTTRGVSGQSERFYENVREINEVENELRGRARAGKDADAILLSEPLAELIGMNKAVDRRIQVLRRQRRAVVEAGEPGYKEQSREIQEAIGEAMGQLNREARAARQRRPAAER